MIVFVGIVDSCFSTLVSFLIFILKSTLFDARSIFSPSSLDKGGLSKAILGRLMRGPFTKKLHCVKDFAKQCR